jgi:hypothetical protein
MAVRTLGGSDAASRTDRDVFDSNGSAAVRSVHESLCASPQTRSVSSSFDNIKQHIGRVAGVVRSTVWHRGRRRGIFTRYSVCTSAAMDFNLGPNS